MTERIYLSTTIPYVNGRAHGGHALELVQADVLARHHRQIGDEVRLQSGTDDNSLKNVLAAAAEGISTRELVDRNAGQFASLREHLSLSFDDFIRTSSDPRHRPGVERLWRACQASGDLYRRTYAGLYCVGCEQFYTEAELISTAGSDSVCPEHGEPPQLIAEENWFFRLSAYGDRLAAEINSGRLRIEPASRRNEVLGFIAAGLEDFSASRSVERARGWGIGVPGDPTQVIYVWWDALGNYVTSLGAGAVGEAGAAYQHWWAGADERVHVAGKGVLRFHAVYWPAILLSAGLPLPTQILVHDYLTVDGAKISKSAPGQAAGDNDPVVLTSRYGADALRWWLIRDVPRTGDTDFTVARLVSRANEDLANGLGNLVSRVVTLAHRYSGGTVRAVGPAGPAWPQDARALGAAIEQAPGTVRASLARFDLRAAAAGVWAIVEAANRYVDATEPWHLGRAGDPRFGEVLGALLTACQTVAAELAPFLPGLAGRVAAACDLTSGRLPAPAPVFPRLEVPVPVPLS